MAEMIIMTNEDIEEQREIAYDSGRTDGYESAISDVASIVNSMKFMDSLVKKSLLKKMAELMSENC